MREIFQLEIAIGRDTIAVYAPPHMGNILPLVCLLVWRGSLEILRPSLLVITKA